MNEEHLFQPDLGDVSASTNASVIDPDTASNFSPDLGKTEKETTVSFNTYVCSTCHTSFSTLNPSVTNCIFCGGTSITKGEGESFSDCSYLPFIVTLDEAFANYKKHIRMNPLVPFSFRGKKVKKKIRKAYIPCSLFNISVEGNITSYGADKISKIKGAPMQTFESLYSTHFDYLNLLASNFSKIGDVVVSNINNYHFTTMVDFDSSIMSDSFILNGDVDKNQVTEKIQQKTIKNCVNIVRGNVNHNLKKLADNNMAFGISSATTLLIPVYFINFRYKGHEYLYIMNGQTEETIIDVPTSAFNIILFCILFFLFIVLMGCLIIYFK